MSSSPSKALKRPVLWIVIACFSLLLLWMGFPSTSSTTPDPKPEKPPLASPKASVDPRDIWADEMKASVDTSLVTLNDTLLQLKEQLQSQQHTNAALQQQIDQLQSPAPSTIRPVETSYSPAPALPATPEMLHLTLNTSSASPTKPSEKERMPSLSHARAVLLTGAAVSTAVATQGAPEPVVLRIVGEGRFSNGYTTPQLNHAQVLASCYGDLSKERAVCRLERLSLKNQQGELIETPVEGWIFGEDGRVGMKGDIVDKSSDVARMAVLNGILGGMASFFQNQAQSSVYPISPISGPQNALKGAKAMESGAASGAGNALQRLADYAIKRAEQLSPIVQIESGRTVDLVFEKGVSLSEVIASAPSGTPASTNSSSTPFSPALPPSNSTETAPFAGATWLSHPSCSTCSDSPNEESVPFSLPNIPQIRETEGL